MNEHQTSFDVMAMATVVKQLLNDAPPDKREAVLAAAPKPRPSSDRGLFFAAHLRIRAIEPGAAPSPNYLI